MASKVTLKQVAAHAGVSYQTVSKVLNKQVQVSKGTEQRILNAVTELGYLPNQIARNMRAKRSFMIGYFWIQTSPDQVNHILDHFLTSMVQEAEAAGYHLLPFREGDGDDVIILEGRVEIVRDRLELEKIDATYRTKYVDPGSGAQATIFEPGADLYRVNVSRVMAWEYATVANRTDWKFE